MKIIHVIAYGTLLLALGALLLVGTWLFYPYQVFTYPKDTMEILNENKEAVPGGRLLIRGGTIHHTKGKQVTTSPQLSDGVLVQFPITRYVTEGGEFSSVRTLELPSYLHTGTYRIQFFTSVKMNPLRTMHFIRETEDFKIIESYE